MTHLVLAGAGHAQLAVLHAFARRKLPGTRLTLVTREAFAPYSGMLPGLVAGLYRYADAHVDVARLAGAAGAVFVMDEVCGLDLAGRRLLTRRGPPVGFDLLSLDTGAGPDTTVPGADGYAIPVKPIDGFLRRFDALCARLAPGQRVAVVGSGAGGVELMLAITRRLPAQRFVLVSGTEDILPGFPASFRARVASVLRERGVEVVAGAPVGAVRAGWLDTARGPVAADGVLWATQAAAAPWVGQSGLMVDARGFLCVDAHLRAEATVFAAGDMAAMVPPVPKSGVYAVRAGPVLAHNLRAALTGGRLRRYRPQARALYILSTGERYGVATRNGLSVGGRWVWRWKDRLDRGFVTRFNV